MDDRLFVADRHLGQLRESSRRHRMRTTFTKRELTILRTRLARHKAVNKQARSELHKILDRCSNEALLQLANAKIKPAVRTHRRTTNFAMNEIVATPFGHAGRGAQGRRARNARSQAPSGRPRAKHAQGMLGTPRRRQFRRPIPSRSQHL
jgi:hypothetical protein